MIIGFIFESHQIGFSLIVFVFQTFAPYNYKIKMIISVSDY